MSTSRQRKPTLEKNDAKSYNRRCNGRRRNTTHLSAWTSGSDSDGLEGLEKRGGGEDAKWEIPDCDRDKMQRRALSVDKGSLERLLRSDAQPLAGASILKSATRLSFPLFIPVISPSCPTVDRTRDLVYYPRAVHAIVARKRGNPFPTYVASVAADSKHNVYWLAAFKFAFIAIN